VAIGAEAGGGAVVGSKRHVAEEMGVLRHAGKGLLEEGLDRGAADETVHAEAGEIIDRRA
jgi:hypothetical protein